MIHQVVIPTLSDLFYTQFQNLITQTVKYTQFQNLITQTVNRPNRDLI
jgi:hypothetical protein